MGKIPTTVYLEKQEIIELEALAQKRATSKSSAIRVAIKKMLKEG